jgi:hypothetical protein
MLYFTFRCVFTNCFILQPDSQVHIHWKGAAEIVLASCTEYINASGKIVPLDQDKVGLSDCFL